VKWKFAFGLASDDLFFVTVSAYDPVGAGFQIESAITTFTNENEFLKLVVAADLDQPESHLLLSAVIIAVARPISPPAWIEVNLSPQQILRLGIRGFVETPWPFPSTAIASAFQSGIFSSMPHFYDLLMQAPTPLAMFWGAEHRFAFINASWAQLLGPSRAGEVIGQPLVDAYPELKEQHFIDLLDQVFTSGEAQSVTECRCSFFRERSGKIEEGYFNTSYKPVSNARGEITGILVQTVEVTEDVLARAVRENREALLYRQWAELESIYRNAPIGLALVKADDLSVLRINERQAELMGKPVAALLGKALPQDAPDLPRLRQLIQTAAAGIAVESQVLHSEEDATTGNRRHWLVSFSPTFSATGKIEAITSVSFEITPETKGLLAPDQQSTLMF